MSESAHTALTATPTGDDPGTSPAAVTPVPDRRRFDLPYLARFAVLALGALVFLFPFYYMLVGSLQAESDTSLGGAFPIGGWTLDNYRQINERVDLAQSLLNSGIVTGGVILGTVFFGV